MGSGAAGKGVVSVRKDGLSSVSGLRLSHTNSPGGLSGDLEDGRRLGRGGIGGSA